MARPRIPHRPAGGKKPKVGKSDERQTSIDAPAAPARSAVEAEERSPRQGVPALKFDTVRDVVLTKVALEERIAALKKLATRNAEEGYPREARNIEGDCIQLAERILVQLEDQTEMELDGGDSVDFGIMNHLRDLVHAHVKDKSEAFDHEEILLKALGEKVGRYVRAVADRAFAAGVHARSSDSASLALGALEHL